MSVSHRTPAHFLRRQTGKIDYSMITPISTSASPEFAEPNPIDSVSSSLISHHSMSHKILELTIVDPDLAVNNQQYALLKLSTCKLLRGVPETAYFIETMQKTRTVWFLTQRTPGFYNVSYCSRTWHSLRTLQGWLLNSSAVLSLVHW